MIRKLFNQCLECLVGLLDCIEVAIDFLRIFDITELFWNYQISRIACNFMR